MKDESRIVEETRKKIASGELTYDQMKEKLIVAINKEYEREGEPNIELINACEELLAELATEGQPLPESHQEKCREMIRQNIQVSHSSSNKGGFAKRLAISLIVFVLLLGGGQVFLHREWFEHGATDDEQQHTVQGFVVDPNLIAKCIAEEGVSSAMYFCDNYDEIKQHLGFDLPHNCFLDDWEPIQYFVGIQSAYVKCSIKYRNPQTEEQITVQVGMFTGAENAYNTFEQIFKGTQEIIDKTITYYITNEGDSTIMWVDKNCIWSCHGFGDKDQIKFIAERIIGGK